MRVHEELAGKGIEIPYSTLSGYCRREGIRINQKKRTGEYHFDPGEEMQHDTSPHDVVIGKKKTRVQCASCVLCFCRKMYAQVYPTFNRFYCKIFLTEAVQAFGGAAARCMIDNTHVVIASGTGKNAVIAPEMVSFSERLGFEFEAHEKGDANRSARVEGPFYYIERNFYPGRTFSDIGDLNRQLAAWCEKKSHRRIRTIGARPIDLYQTERLHLKPLPIYIPPVYALHFRLVNLEGNIHLHNNRYSVPDALIGKKVEVRETKDKVVVYVGHTLVAEHDRAPEGAAQRIVCKVHRTPEHRPQKSTGTDILPEEKTLRTVSPQLDRLIAAIRKEGRGRPLRHIRKLYRFYLDYPTDILCKTIERALDYNLTDLDRIERMTLRAIAGDYFRLPDLNDKDNDNG